MRVRNVPGVTWLAGGHSHVVTILDILDAQSIVGRPLEWARPKLRNAESQAPPGLIEDSHE